jgi:RND family efflux transporter MFP subunit
MQPGIVPSPTRHEPPRDGAPRSRGVLRRLALLAVLAGVSAGLAFVIYAGIQSRERSVAELRSATLDAAVPTVSVVQPRFETTPEEIVLPGNVQAYVSTPIYARTNGYLRRWYFDIGSHVRAGDLLAEIETPEIDRQLDQARAELAIAQANYRLAESTAARYQNLLKTDSVSRQDTEEKIGDLQAKKAVVESAAANVRRLEETVRFQKIYAPFDGVITARNVDTGALIDAGANAPGKELFDIAATDRLRVFVNIPQTYLHSAVAGAPAYLTVAELPGRRFAGRIVRNSKAIDPASRTLLTEVDVDNRGGALLPGQYVSVHLTAGGKHRAMLLPANTLLFRSEGLRVAVVRGGKAVLTPITIGRDFGDSVEVLTGVTPDDRVIENPSDSLTSGTPVRVAESRDGGAASGGNAP